MSDDFIHSLFLASLTSTYLVSLLILFRKDIIKLTGARWCYYLWFSIFIPWIVVWLPIDVFPDLEIHLPLLRFPLDAQYQIGSIQLLLLPKLIGIIWLVGAGLVFCFFLLSHVLFLFHLKQHVSLLSMKEATITKNMFANKNQIPLSRIYLSALITSPIICHVFRSKIYLPSDFYETYSLSEQRYILQHESIHYQRCDLIANTLMLLLICVNWFNPMIIFSYHYFRITQELSCDAILADQFSSAEKLAYGHTLLKSSLEKSRHVPKINCRWNNRKCLKERLSTLKSHTAKPLKNLLGVILLVIAFSIATLAPSFGKPDESRYLKISNASGKQLTLSMNHQCFEKLGLMNSHSVTVISYKQLKQACKNNLSHCDMQLFTNKNCSGHPFVLVVFDLVLVQASITALSEEYKLGLYDNNLFIEPK